MVLLIYHNNVTVKNHTTEILRCFFIVFQHYYCILALLVIKYNYFFEENY